MTNREIAKQLGISPAALSLIINHKSGVSDATRAQVLQQLKDMGYEHLIKKVPVAPANNLAFVIYKRHGDILDHHPFFLLLMENIETHARKFGYNTLIFTIDKRHDLEPQIQHLEEMNCKGAILFATEMYEDDMAYFDALTMPLVTLDNDFPYLSCNSVSINNQMGTHQAIRHLVEHGLTEIGYLKSQRRISSFDEREQGYKAALKAYSLKLKPENIIDLHYSEEGSYRDMRSYLQDHPSIPEAFVCDDDTIAAGAIHAITEYGYRVPTDISIIGFNDRPTCEVTNPPLTSINVSKHSFAVEAVNELLRLIDHSENSSEETRSRKIRIGTKLVVRNSVK